MFIGEWGVCVWRTRWRISTGKKIQLSYGARGRIKYQYYWRVSSMSFVKLLNTNPYLRRSIMGHKHRNWTYSNVAYMRCGTMICTACSMPITDGQFRYIETDDRFYCQHRACSLQDPKWEMMDRERLIVSAPGPDEPDMEELQRSARQWRIIAVMMREELNRLRAKQATPPCPLDIMVTDLMDKKLKQEKSSDQPENHNGFQADSAAQERNPGAAVYQPAPDHSA